MVQNIDDLKLEVLIAMEEEGLLSAQKLAKLHFPMVAFDIKSAVLFCLNLYLDFYGVEYPRSKYFESITKLHL